MSIVTCSHSHRTIINIQSALHTFPDFLKLFHSPYYLVATVVRIESTQANMCIHTHSSKYRDVCQAKEMKNNCDSSECIVPRKSFRLPFWARVPWVRQPWSRAGVSNYGKGPQRLLWASLQPALRKITICGIPNCPNYCESLQYTYSVQMCPEAVYIIQPGGPRVVEPWTRLFFSLAGLRITPPRQPMKILHYV